MRSRLVLLAAILSRLSLFAFAAGLSRGVPISQLAENIIDGRAVFCASPLQPHTDDVAWLEGYNDSFFVMTELHSSSPRELFFYFNHEHILS